MKENRKIYQYNAKYNHTSEAYEYDYNYNYEATYKPKVKVRKKRKEVYVKAEQNVKLYSFKLFVLGILGVAAVVSAVNIEAQSIQKRFEIDKLNKTLAEIEESNINLETKLAQNLDLEYIEKMATDELNMQKPSSHQIMHINVPKESYSQKNDISSNESFLSQIIDMFKR